MNVASVSACAPCPFATSASAPASALNRRMASRSTLFEMTTDNDSATASTTASNIAAELAATRVGIEWRPAPRNAAPSPSAPATRSQLPSVALSIRSAASERARALTPAHSHNLPPSPARQPIGAIARSAMPAMRRPISDALLGSSTTSEPWRNAAAPMQPSPVARAKRWAVSTSNSASSSGSASEQVTPQPNCSCAPAVDT